jgi:hypothetical protein
MAWGWIGGKKNWNSLEDGKAREENMVVKIWEGRRRVVRIEGVR